MFMYKHLFPLWIAITLLGACSPKEEPAIYQGYVEGDFVYVSSSQAGRLDHLAVTRGQVLALQTPLFVLESENEAAAQRQAQQQLSSAQAQLADLQTGKRPQELDVTRAQLAQAIAEAKRTAVQLARDEAQVRSGFISKAALDDSRAAADSAAAQVRQMSSSVEVGKLASREEQIKAQSAAVAAAQAALEQANWKLTQKAVTAPQAGVVFDTLYRQGEWVAAGAPVVRLLPPQNIKVRFFVPETLIGGLAAGRQLSIHCDGCAADIPAIVTYVATEAEYTPPVIYSNENRAKLVYMIEAYPSVADAFKLHPGQPITVSLP